MNLSVVDIIHGYMKIRASTEDSLVNQNVALDSPEYTLKVHVDCEVSKCRK